MENLIETKRWREESCECALRLDIDTVTCACIHVHTNTANIYIYRDQQHGSTITFRLDRQSPYRLQSIETRTVTALARTCLKSKGEPCHCVYTVLVNPTFIIFYLYILGGRVVSGQCCPSATLSPLLALLPRRPDTVGLLSQDPARGQAFSQVKGRGMRWWCHRGCWRVTWKVGGGPSRGDSVTH